MTSVLIQLVSAIGTLFTLVLIVDIILSYFMSPYHPLRMTLDRIVQPLLSPIRRIVPPMGMIDFSPIVLLVLIQIIETLLVGLINLIAGRG